MSAPRTTPLLLLLSLACTPTPVTSPRGATPGPVVIAVLEPEVESGPMAPTLPPKVDVTLFMMSQCPWAAQMLLALTPQLDKLGDRVVFRTEYIGKVTPAGELKSMKGETEVAGDIIQLCAQRHTPKWRDLLQCQAADPEHADTNLRECAAASGIDARPIEVCALSDEGTKLVAASFERSKAAGATGSPTLHIDGKKYEGSRRPTAMLRAVCDEMSQSSPAACTDFPPPPQVAVTLLEDARCTTCTPSDRTRKTLEAKLENPLFSALDYGTAEGKALHRALGEVRLPAAIFDASLDGDPDAIRMLRGLEQVGDRRFLALGTHNPQCLDEGGCKLASCRLTTSCRKEEPRVLELFMMSKCPFAAKGIKGLAEVLGNFEKNREAVVVRANFIGSGDAKTGFKAMRGAREVEENLRQVCAFKLHAGRNKFLRYLQCRAEDLKSDDWAACTGKSTGIDKAALEACSTGEEGKRLLEASNKRSADSGFGASPTWLASAKHKFSGIDAQQIKEEFCKHNKLKGCDTTLTGPASPQASTP